LTIISAEIDKELTISIDVVIKGVLIPNSEIWRREGITVAHVTRISPCSFGIMEWLAAVIADFVGHPIGIPAGFAEFHIFWGNRSCLAPAQAAMAEW